MELKKLLQAKGLWSQYLEVGIGPDAEIFTKCQLMSSVGTGMSIGVLASSTWNNPEPEVVLVATSKGEIVGATLGNDVNLRDVEGRSALLLSQGQGQQRLDRDRPVHPPVRPHLLARRRAPHAGRAQRDRHRRLRARRRERCRQDQPRPGRILSTQMIGRHHQYPDGAVLFLGTMFAPVKDRDAPGMGFTHHVGDVVTIAADKLGALINVVTTCDQAPEWTFGVGDSDAQSGEARVAVTCFPLSRLRERVAAKRRGEGAFLVVPSPAPQLRPTRTAGSGRPTRTAGRTRYARPGRRNASNKTEEIKLSANSRRQHSARS